MFDSNARVIFPSTRIGGNREHFQQVVRSIANLTDGLRLGYKQVMANFHKKYVNRVRFLTDGVGASNGIFDMAQSSFGNHFTVVDRRMIETVLAEQQLSLSDLMETTEAIKVGRVLSADYILTGTVIPMSSSVVIFGRIIDTETTAVESAAQVIVPIDAELRNLL